MILPGELKTRHELRRGVILPPEQAEGNFSAADRGAEGLLAQVAAGIKDKGFAHGDASPYGSSWFSPVTALPVSSAVK